MPIYRSPLGFMIATLVIGAGACTSGVSTARERETTVCELHDALASPPSGRVHVKALLFAGPRHGTILTDARCRGKSVGVRFVDPIPSGSTLERFEKALSGDVMDLSLRAFEVQVSGVVKPAGPGMPESLLVIDRVDSFSKQESADISR
ncbi:hypothetical protein [Luteibacter yeojuensis]|uniref:Lipoprotein n=1 Tax=Luteibacter yeojuensis TaxID=345309 RepID=A0A7X5TNE5_9GAMM|nr:hypothetical protein [Luteibacter yeojuensis]NID14506.1 hypothetical protein [Luteibacter yeojuensis]